MIGGGADERRESHSHVNYSELSGPADLVQARDVHGGVHFHGGGAPSAEPPPRQLPGDVRGFVNRHQELTFLDSLLATDQGDGQTITLTVITGTAGVGKTSLALRWAHRVRQHFPDGQLYVNLRGYDPGQPATPEQVLDRFLRALGVPAAAIPADSEDRAALYRSRLADRRMLVVLDNAATVSQVRPLLPGTGACLVIVTSRSRLSGLVARDGGRRLTLDMLPEDDAIALLDRIISPYRADDDPHEVAELARLCARLPLALRIAAERAASRPLMPLDELIQDLRDESALWDALSTGDDDEADAVRTVFAWSYRALAEETARVFRLLGLHPGPEFSAAAAAALAGVPRPRIRQLLDALVGAHLLEHRAPDRYQLHDLLRAYALDQARALEPEEQRQKVLRRILDWYLLTADAALAKTLPFDRRIELEPPADVVPLSFASGAEADAWYDAERDNLVAATRAAARAGLHRTTWQLAAVLRSVFMHRNAFDDWQTTAQLGLTAARALSDRYAEAELLESLGKAAFQARRLSEAAEHHRAALEIRRQLGDRFGEAVSANALGLLGLRHRRLDDSLRHFHQALTIFEEIGNRRWKALLLCNLGETCYELARLPEAADLLHRALAIQREIGDRGQEGNSLFFLSMTWRESGRMAEARESIEAALTIARDAGNPVWRAHWLVEQARVLRAMGEPAAALEAVHTAATLQRQVGDRSREAMALDGAGEAYVDLGQPEEAIRFHVLAATIHRQLDDAWQLALTLVHLATALTQAGRPAEAIPHLVEAHTLASQFPDARAVALCERIGPELDHLGDI
ncbi:tetratricopeptide repeat protein [Micromonospora sp. HM5-17]|uniref:ATP-binding protein n=1 Tax=Micromonospora sp. HM5-17 TaxID=2487710 RepID=UPI0018F5F2E4|nr:tetratricopeptide repeat protein [Micromonospora sp. HM5-17]